MIYDVDFVFPLQHLSAMPSLALCFAIESHRWQQRCQYLHFITYIWIPNTFIDDSIQEILGSYNDLCRTTKTLFNCVSIDLKFVLCFFQLLYNFIMFFIYIFSPLIRSSSILICCLCIKMEHVKKPYVIYISELL